MKVKYLNMAAEQTLTVAEEEISLENLGDEMVAGKTLYTLVSVGTEFNGIYMNALNTVYPRKFGYAAVFQVEHIGKSVVGIEVGDIVFTKAQHKSYQIDNYKNVVKIPKGVLPEHAILSRLAGVSMATLKQTRIPSGEKVLVTGLGAVGFMAMQIFGALGYEVIGVEPNAHRRSVMEKLGFTVFESVPFHDERYNKKIALALECSGIESAVLDCCNIVRPRGEVSLVGVPWKQYCDITSQQLLHTVFYKYVTLYSGWECDLPRENSAYVYTSENQNYRTCLRFIEAGQMSFDGSYLIKPYTEAPQVFEDIKNKKADQVFTIFSWKECE